MAHEKIQNEDGEFLQVSPAFSPYFNCENQDPCSENGSGSTKLLDMDPNWIRIHNTEVL